MNLDASDFAATGPAFVAGLVTSLHCAGMCAPLSCSLLGTRGADQNVSATIYHATRLASYGLVGALSGAIGAAPLRLLTESALSWLAWLLVLFFIALAFRWERHLPAAAYRIPFAGRFLFRLRARPPRSGPAAAALLGLATPLLPCAPLYMLFAFAMISGSAIHGAEVAVAFGLGTVPLLWIVQFSARRFATVLPPAALARTRTTIALAAAAVIAWRLRATLGLPGPDPLSFVCF